MNYWPLLGIALVVIGFALRFNPLLVVFVAGIFMVWPVPISMAIFIAISKFCLSPTFG